MAPCTGYFWCTHHQGHNFWLWCSFALKFKLWLHVRVVFLCAHRWGHNFWPWCLFALKFKLWLHVLVIFWCTHCWGHNFWSWCCSFWNLNYGFMYEWFFYAHIAETNFWSWYPFTLKFKLWLHVQVIFLMHTLLGP